TVVALLRAGHAPALWAASSRGLVRKLKRKNVRAFRFPVSHVVAGVGAVTFVCLSFTGSVGLRCSRVLVLVVAPEKRRRQFPVHVRTTTQARQDDGASETAN
ncbi:unnamed protein product, partial [Ixodes persulcatus]